MLHPPTRNLLPAFIQQMDAAGARAGTLDCCALFADISGFTAATESLVRASGVDGAETLWATLRDLFTPAVEAVHGHGGLIVGFAGDSFTALFPSDGKDAAPDRATDAARHALACAREIVRHFGAGLPVAGVPHLRLGVKIGLAVGVADWGILGTTRRTYYFRGTAIDACAHAEKRAATGEIWGSAAFLRLVLPGGGSGAPFEAISGAITPQLPPAIPCLPPPIHMETIRRFLGDDVARVARAEFRKVVAAFLVFDERIDFRHLVHGVLDRLEAYGGVLPRVDFGDKGGNLLLLFGAPVSHENTAARALSLLESIRHDAAPESLRGGIATGICYCGFNGSDTRSEFTFLGNTINLAARLATSAPWGQFQTDSGMAGTRGFAFTPLGATAYKGFPQPVPTFRLDGESLDGDATFRRAVLGREAELARLEAHLMAGLAGRPRVARIAGEAGMGKTRLVHELERRLRRRLPLRWALCTCDDILRSSLNPFRAFVARHLGQRAGTATDRRTFDHAWARVAASLPPSSARLAAELERTRPFLARYAGIDQADRTWDQMEPRLRLANTVDAVVAFLAALAGAPGMCLVVDDAMWIDDDSRRLLQRLVRAEPRIPVILVGRNLEELPRLHDGVPEAGLDICLGAMDREQMRGLVREVAGGALSAALVERVVARAAGNPLFAEHLALDLRERQPAEREAPDVALPEHIQGVLISRLDRLAPAVRQVVLAGAVLGPELDARVLRRVLGPAAGVDAGLRLAADAAIWRPAGEPRYAFSHALVRDAAYGMQVGARRLELHRAAAAAIEELFAEDLGSHLAELAHHFDRGRLPGRAATCYERAALRAQEGFENQDALRFIERLLQLAPEAGPPWDGSRIARVRLKETQILAVVGRWDEAMAIHREEIRAGRDRGDAAAVADHLGGLSWLVKNRGDFDEALALAREAVALGDGAPERMARLHELVGHVHYDRCENAAALDSYARALALARQCGDGRRQCQVMNSQANIQFRLGCLDRALELNREMLAIAQGLGNLEMEGWALGGIGVVHMTRGEDETARGFFDAYARISRQVGHRMETIKALGNLAILDERAHRLDQAIHTYRELLPLCRELADPRLEHVVLGNMGSVLARQGRFREARQRLEEKLAMCAQIGDVEGKQYSLDSLGRLGVDEGDVASALGCFDQVVALYPATGNRSLLADGLVGRATCLLRLGRKAEAAAAARDARTLALELGQDDRVRTADEILGRTAPS